MPETIYNPLLKRGFQELGDTTKIETDLTKLKNSAMIKAATLADLAALAIGSIFQWQGETQTNPDLVKGFFYEKTAADTYTQTDAQPRLQNVANGNGGTVIISANTEIAGDLTVSGTSTTVHAQQVESENDYITLRKNNPLGLANGDYSGMEIDNYDGNNTNLKLVVGNDGWARVGDSGGTLQKLATIQENPTNGQFVKYNTTTKELESAALPTAAANIPGVVKVGTGLAIDGNGVLSAMGGAENKVTKINTVAGLNNIAAGELFQWQGETITTPYNLHYGWFYKKQVTTTKEVSAGEVYIHVSDLYTANMGGFVVNEGYYTPVEWLADNCNGYVTSQYNGLYYLSALPATIGQKVCVSTDPYFQSANSFVKFTEVATIDDYLPATYADGATYNAFIFADNYTGGKIRKYKDINNNYIYGAAFTPSGANYINVFLWFGYSNGVFYPIANKVNILEKTAVDDIIVTTITLNQTDTQPNTGDGSAFIVNFTPDTSAVRANIQSGQNIAQMAASINNYLSALNIAHLYFADYTTVLAIIDVTDWYVNNSNTDYGYHIVGLCSAIRLTGFISDSAVFNICAVANWNRLSVLKVSKNSSYSVNIVSYNSRYYIAIARNFISATNLYIYGHFNYFMNTPLQLKESEVTIIYSGTDY